MDASTPWETIYVELKKEKPLTVLFFINHYYYKRSIKDLGLEFGMRADSISKSLNLLQGKIRKAFEEEGGTIGRSDDCEYDGHLIGSEVLRR